LLGLYETKKCDNCRGKNKYSLEELISKMA